MDSTCGRVYNRRDVRDHVSYTVNVTHTALPQNRRQSTQIQKSLHSSAKIAAQSQYNTEDNPKTRTQLTFTVYHHYTGHFGLAEKTRAREIYIAGLVSTSGEKGAGKTETGLLHTVPKLLVKSLFYCYYSEY